MPEWIGKEEWKSLPREEQVQKISAWLTVDEDLWNDVLDGTYQFEELIVNFIELGLIKILDVNC